MVLIYNIDWLYIKQGILKIHYHLWEMWQYEDSKSSECRYGYCSYGREYGFGS